MMDANKIIGALQSDPKLALELMRAQGGAILDRIKTDPAARNMAIGVGLGALGGVLAGPAGARFLGGVAKVGAVAALGGLAWHAWKSHEARQGQGEAPSHDGPYEAPPAGFLPKPNDPDLGKAILRAMIAAAKADGNIDSEEKRRLFDRLGQVDLGEDEQSFLFDELTKPLDIDAVAAGARTPEMAAQIYAASLVAIDPDLPAEKEYLIALAGKLKLPAGLVQELHDAARR